MQSLTDFPNVWDGGLWPRTYLGDRNLERLRSCRGPSRRVHLICRKQTARNLCQISPHPQTAAVRMRLKRYGCQYGRIKNNGYDREARQPARFFLLSSTFPSRYRRNYFDAVFIISLWLHKPHNAGRAYGLHRLTGLGRQGTEDSRSQGGLTKQDYAVVDTT